MAGYAAALTGDPVQSCAYFERGLALYRKIGDSRGIAWSIRGCGFVRMLCGEYPAAEQLDTESLRLCQSSGDAWGLAWSLYGLAFLKLAQGEWARAQSLIEDALVRLRQQGIIFAIFRALLALGHVMFEQGDVAYADALYREGLAFRQGTLFLQYVADGLEGRGKVVATLGMPCARCVSGERRRHCAMRSAISAGTSSSILTTTLLPLSAGSSRMKSGQWPGLRGTR